MNTKTYPRELRFRWYLQVEKYGRSVSATCAIFGLSRKTYYKWHQLDHGGGSNQYHSPHGQPATKLTPEVRQLIEQEKQRTNYGPLKMKLLLQRRLGLAVSTTIIYRYYVRRKLVRRPQKKLPWYKPLTDPIIPQKPGEVMQIDTKYVWERGQRKYQRTFVDVYTGFQYAVVMPTLEAQNTVVAFQKAERVFLFPILGVQTDNGSENRGVFHQYLGERGLAHYFVPKNSPNWQGAVERAHGTIDQEYYFNPTKPWRTITDYLHWYNHERIHLGKYLKGLTPMEKLQIYQQRVLPLTVN
ncbi:MAG: DDE-type integrase/transposase/recombinase [Candidatus Kerfeldbacteria bacterium]|nr:DDE-type integrase/transposase/recombinase [Candidatus Kerfeldbacteria bacterium]